MTALDGYGYEWVEATTAGDLAEGRRVFIRGREIRPAKVRLAINSSQGRLEAWVDEDSRERWRAPGAEVPATWRRVYVEERA